ncbi:MAG: hypothetical protein ABIG08_02770 [bacterium]
MTKIDFLITRDRCRSKEGNIRDINLVKTFLKKGYSCGMISSCQLIHSQLKKDGIFSVQMLKTIKIPSKLENIEERAERIEKEYNIPSLKRFIFPEKCYNNEDEGYLFRKAIIYFEELEKLFNRIEVKCLIQGQGGQINIRALYFIAKKRGIPVIYFAEHLFPNKILLFPDEMKTLDRFKNISWTEMTDRQREEIEEYLRQFRNRQGVFTDILAFAKKDDIIRGFISLQEYLKNKKFQGLIAAFIRKFKQGIFRTFNKFFSSFLYQNSIKDEKFIYFPLHVPDDCQITLRNLHFFDQAVLALYMARSLPFGYKLYIKEHPGNFISVQTKTKLIQEKNIILLHPSLNSHQIIKKSQAIITINSTVGFEALHYFKPVIVLGNWNLRGRGATIDVQDLSKLDEAIRFALQKIIDPNKIKAFLFSFKESMYEGDAMAPVMDYDKIADLLIDYKKNMKK